MTKTILITGASTGIGQATAEWFFERGWNVAATMRSPESHPAADRSDSRWLTCRLDVTDPKSIASALQEALSRYGRIDVWVNNAGYGLSGTLESATEQQIQRQFDTNVFGLIRCTQAILPHFRNQKSGTLINVSSMGGRLTFPLYSLYHATKWAVEGLSESLQFEVRPLNIRVKIIEPGPIRTDFYDRSADFCHNRDFTEYNELVDQAVRTYQKAGEHGQPPEVVARVIWKAARDRSWKLRYPAGRDARILLTLRSLLPNRLYQAVVRSQVFGRTRLR